MATIKVIETTSKETILGAKIYVNGTEIPRRFESNGIWNHALNEGDKIKATAFKKESPETQVSGNQASGQEEVSIELDLGAKCGAYTEDGRAEISYCRAGEFCEVRADIHEYPNYKYEYSWEAGIITGKGDHEPQSEGLILEFKEKQNQRVIHIDTSSYPNKTIYAKVTITDVTDKSSAGASVFPEVKINVRQDGTHAMAAQMGRMRASTVSDGVSVSLSRTDVTATPDLLLWFLIEESTNSLSFNNYQAFMNYLLCLEPLPDPLNKKTEFTMDKPTRHFELRGKRFLPFTDADAYRLLKVGTEAFLAVNCAVKIDNTPDDLTKLLDKVSATEVGDLKKEYMDEYLKMVQGNSNKTLPYLAFVLQKLPDLRGKIKDQIFRDFEKFDEWEKAAKKEECYGILLEKLTNPCLIELIWSYWHEQGMLVQTMNAISRRFQNVRGPADLDPLAGLELDPLRPLNNLLWGYIQDEQHRLSLVRRAYEYDHHYGLTLEGKAVPKLRPADSRSRFLEAFHNLLYLVSVFYKQDDDTTIEADAFPVLKALQDLHLLLSEGAHNQFGDLPSTARIEMLMEQWLLARPEFREVLPTRIMVAYPEPWMDRVDAMKRLQNWVDTSVLHFRNLGAHGEQILLSVRFGAWADPNNDPDQAKIWARFWRTQIQGYIYAYRAVTGIDLSAEITTTQQRALITTEPSVLLRQRLPAGRTAPALPAPAAPTAPQGFRERRAARRLTRG
jgi:hypothetical protein